MPRHPRKELRLVRVRARDAAATSYALPPAEVRIESRGVHENYCNCALPWCSWPADRARAERGYKPRRGAWVTADGRFRLEWAQGAGSRVGVSRAHPGGHLRVWDSVLMVGEWVTSMKAARELIAQRYGIVVGVATTNSDGG